MDVNELLAATPSPDVGNQLILWVKELPERILRGDMIIGILLVDEVALAPKALRKAHKCGVEDALLQLGNWLGSPPWGEPDPDGAAAAYREAIRLGVPGAKLRLAEFMWFVCRESAMQQESIDAYQTAKELAKSDARALYLLGLLTHAGFGTCADPERACVLMKDAAEKGNADAMFEAYIYHEMGLGTAKAPEAALAYLRRAAELGQVRAMYNIGACLAKGRGMGKDPVEAAEWYQRASDAGHVRATVNLAMMYAYGDGVDRDLERAKEFFDQAEYAGLDVSDLRRSVGL